MPKKIEQRGKNTYLLTVADGYDEKGKQIFRRKRIKATSEREAQKDYIEFAAEVKNNLVAYTGKLKITDFARQWFKDYCQKELAPKTQASYKNHLEKRILPALGHVDLNKLTPQHVIKFLNNLREKDTRFDEREGTISEEVIRYCFRVLSSMLRHAVQWQIIAGNPCDRVKPPSQNHTHIKIMDKENLSKMFACIETEHIKYRTIILLAVASGLRLGEFVGLKWSDVDFEKCVLHVTKSNQAMKGRGIFTKSPKNETSFRDVAISASVIDLLKKYRDEQDREKNLLAEKWIGEDWIFTQWNGLPMFSTTPSHWFSKFLKKHNLPHIAFHDLRHLSATLLISFGVPLKNISSRLGHADIRTTANIYGAALQSVDRQAANQMNQYWKNVGEENKSD